DYFEALATKIFPELLNGKSPEESIRAWVPGCATGEEAYSITICLTEFLERAGANVPIQLFASVISDTAIEKARAGIYTVPALAEVSPGAVETLFRESQRWIPDRKIH